MSELVEVPLTKAQKNHIKNVEREKAKRKHRTAKRELELARDEQLREANKVYDEAVAKLKETRNKKHNEIWKEFRDKSSKLKDE